MTMKMHSVGAVALGAGLLMLGACAIVPRAPVARFTPCDDVQVDIYFTTGSSTISRDARAVLGGAAEQARGCRVDSIDVLGLADATGDPASNLKLSEQRAAAVTKALRDLGLKDARVTAAGEAGAAEPLRRRTEVILRLSAGS